MDRGTYLELDGRPAVRFERTYPHDVARVWTAVSDPAELVRWFPSEVRLQPEAGGAVEFFGDPNLSTSTGTVLTYDPPHRIAFTWGDDELHVELTAVDGGCRLTLVDVLERRDAAARNASGWTVCLGELDKLLAAMPSDGPHGASSAPFQPIYDEYVAAGMPSGAPIP